MDHDAGAVTIHVYAPPIRALGHYEIIDGELHRSTGPPDEPSPASTRLLDALGPSPCRAAIIASAAAFPAAIPTVFDGVSGIAASDVA